MRWNVLNFTWKTLQNIFLRNKPLFAIYIYDRNLEGITLYPGETREDSLVLNILDTNEARTYLNRVNVDGEIYEHVVYILDGNTYKEQDVLEGETITKPADPIENFGGWYTDNKYTNLYNYNNPVTKNLVLNQVQ